MTANPFKDSSKKVQRSRQLDGFEVAEVVAVPDDGSHSVVVRPSTTTSDGSGGTPENASVGVASFGDVSLPTEGSMVVLARLQSGRAVVVDTVYTPQDDVRDFDADERHVGHEDNGGTYLHGPFAAFPSVTEDPQNPPDGVGWYRADLDEYRGVADGTTVSFDTTPI